MNNEKRKILVVDDDELLRRIYVEKFKQEGFEVSEAKDGQEAWEALERGNVPDILFTGIEMPRLGGFDLIRRMQADPKYGKIKIAVFSHQGRVKDKQLAQNLGVKCFLVQGLVTPIEGVRRIKRLLGIYEEFEICLNADKGDGKALIEFLNRQQGIHCNPMIHKKISLELKPGEEKGKFEVKLNCEEEEK